MVSVVLMKPYRMASLRISLGSSVPVKHKVVSGQCGAEEVIDQSDYIHEQGAVFLSTILFKKIYYGL